MEHSMTNEMLEQIKGIAYEQGMKDALSYLAELYESIDETDLWKTYMTEEETN